MAVRCTLVIVWLVIVWLVAHDRAPRVEVEAHNRHIIRGLGEEALAELHMQLSFEHFDLRWR